MIWMFAQFKRLALTLAALSYLVGGAQAGLAASADGEVLVPICTIDGTRYLSVSIGDDAPSETSDMTCPCGLVMTAVTPDEPFNPSVFLPSAPRLGEAETTITLIHSPIWPGAPPIGPPSFQG